MLKGKTVVLGVSGGIASYKILNLVSILIKNGCNVHVIMTKNAVNFINPITFEELTGNRCLIDTFDRNFQHNIEHIALSKKANLVMIAPATANIIGKITHGIADDMLTTTIIACTCKKIVVPSMNTSMYENVIVKDNLKRLKEYGFIIVEAEYGRLASGDIGVGKMPSEKVLFDYILREFNIKSN